MNMLCNFRHVIFFMLLKMINADNGAVLSMCKNNKQLYCTIANDSSSSAISWDTPTKEVSYKYYNITENNALQNSNWTLRKTLKDTFGFEPVLDYRWEGFPTQKCVFPLGEKVELSASVQGKKMILLCKTVEGNNCVKVVFGPGGPFESNDNEQKNCFDHSKTPRDTNWSHFTLISNSTSVYIRQYNSSKVLQVPKTYSKLLVINSKWKLHSFDVYSSEKPRTSVLQIKNDFSETGDICLGLLCYAYGTLKLTLSDSNRVLSAVNNTKEGEWEEIQLCGYIPFNTSMTLEIDTITESKSSKFYIADIIRKFNENDNVRILTKNNPKNQCCQAIKLSKKICTENLTYSRYTSGYSNCSLNSSYTGMWNIQSRNLMPASFIELSANVTGTSAIISWNISSTVVYNGSYEIKCRNINSSEESEETRRIDLTNSNFVELNDLEPNSTYLIMILENADHQLGNITITISAPGPVQNLTVYSVSNHTVELRWLQPYTAYEFLDMYVVEYWKDSTYIYRREIPAGTSQCKIWKNHTCSKIGPLNNDENYTFKVYAKNRYVSNYGSCTNVTATTANTAPAPPENVVYSWNENSTSLALKWNHPYIEKAPISNFFVYIWDPYTLIYTYKVIMEQLEYNCEFQVDFSKLNITFSQDVAICLYSYYDAGEKDTRVNISTPPQTPRFLSYIIMPNVTSTTIDIQIPEITDIDDENSKLYVIITDMQNPADPSTISNIDGLILEKADIDPMLNSWIALEYPLKGNFSKEISIGNTDKNYLVPGNMYRVNLLLQNVYKNISRFSKITLEVTTLGTSYGILFWSLSIIGVIIIIIGIMIFIFCCCKQRKSRENPNEMLPMEHTYEELDLLPEIPDGSKVPGVQLSKYSNRISLQDLQGYVKTCLEKKAFERQYEIIPMGQTHGWKCGMEPENKSKNRYKNIAAYDHTRVKLKVSSKDNVSDYINANYIDGYGVNKAYIATQGPKANTINDFWQMIWQENVEYIIMIANITEGGKKKVEQYWPNITETNIYGNYTVTFTEILVFAEYASKTLKISYKDEERMVYHLHFTCWPDHGVPFYAQSLAPFLKRTIAIPYGKAPIVVHCSAGIGRTGTLILCDICLRMAAKTGEVDVSYNLYKLREQRINMVDNINQYRLVHLVLLHCLIVPDCTIQCTEHMEEEVNITLSDKIHNQMKYIEDSFWQDEAMRSVSTQIDEPVVKEKNRFENILPDKFARIALAPYPVSDASSKYINAVKVDGFCVPFRFIVTQYPLVNTVGDFWRAVDQYETSVIVCLNDLDLSDESCCNFYPKLAELMQPTSYLKVECTNVVKETYYNISTINIQNFEKAEQQRIIKIVHLNKWKYSEQYPATPTALLMTYEEMNYLGKASNTILVACLDGTRASGLFTALCCLIDKIKMEQVCDVCLAVRTVRHSRGEFVRRSEQFAFLYKCALEYVQQFEMYSNFSSQKKS